MSKFLQSAVFMSVSLAASLIVGVAQANEAAAPAAADPAKAKTIVENTCGGCHGVDGNSMIAANPRLAGQHPEYLLKQLQNFKGKDGKPAERKNAVMGGMVAALSDEDMRHLAAYFAGQKAGGGQTKGDRASVDLGQRLWRAGDIKRGLPACAACHGPAGAGLPAQYPRLAGQHADYTEAQLKAFRLSERANDPNKVMQAIAAKMTDAEMKAVADYAAGLR